MMDYETLPKGGINMEEIKRMDIKEFRKLGFLQELNRQFLHPLGLAMEMIIDKETGEERLGGVWDYRDDPEGLLFGELTGEQAERATAIRELALSKANVRLERYGFVIQPVPHKMSEETYDDTRILA